MKKKTKYYNVRVVKEPLPRWFTVEYKRSFFSRWKFHSCVPYGIIRDEISAKNFAIETAQEINRVQEDEFASSVVWKYSV